MKKMLKIIMAIAMVGAVGAAFFGVKGAAWAAKIQPAASVAFIVVLLATPLVGRLFCETMCPLGVLQSFANWIFHPKTKVRRVCTRLPETKAQRIVRWTIFTVSAALFLSGCGALAFIADPYAIFGRAMTAVASFCREEGGELPAIYLAVSLGAFAAVLVLAAFGKGRVWCNWICPAGTLFNLIAKHGACRHQIGKGCANCRKCFGERDKREEIRDKMKECREERVESRDKREEIRDKIDGGVTRREAIEGVAVLAAVAAAEKTTDGGYAPVSLHAEPERARPVLPPGATKNFDRLCVGCGLCVSACPAGVIKPSLSLKSFGQPRLDFRGGHCLTACDQRCARACPAGALVYRTADRTKVHMGYAVWKKENCIRTTDGTACTACERKCPVHAIHIVDGFPVVDRETCIGCGACEHVCPARPDTAMHVEGLDRQHVVVPVTADEVLGEMKNLLAEGAAIVVARGGVIADRAEGRGVKPIIGLYEKGALKDALVADRIIGRAAAAFCVAGGAKEVYGETMGEDAKTYLESRGVKASAGKLVPRILNRDKSGPCPMEKAVEGLDEPVAMIAAVKAALAAMKGA